MAIKSGFFNSVNGDRKYDANRFAEYFATFIGNGVFPNPSNNLQIVANNDMTVTVKAGKAWINGFILINDDDYILNIEPADGVLNRIDRIVARYDTVDREIRLEVKQGNYASSPEPPVLQRDADAYELALADVLVSNGSTSITQANVTDLRINNELCGVVHGTVDQVDTTSIFNQYQAWFNDITSGTEQEIADWQQQQYDAFMIWFQSIQDVLDGDTAGNLLNLINEHKADEVSQGEIHGFRLNQDKKLEYFNGTEYVEVKGGGYPVNIVKNVSAKENDAKVELMWEDPDNVVVDGVTIAEWNYTKVMRKVGSYPLHEEDGELVISNGVRNAYKDTPYSDIGLQNDITYYYAMFPTTTEEIVTISEVSRVSATPTEIKIYGVEIDESNSNPETSIVYTDDAIGFTPASGNNGNFNWGSWENIVKQDFAIKPCVLNNPSGTVNYYLNYDNYTLKEGGGASNLTGADGDVMIEFAQPLWWKFSRVGSNLNIQLSTKQFDGAVNHAFDIENGYNQLSFYPLTMLQVLFLIIFKNRDTQTALGKGLVDNGSTYLSTGLTNTKGFMYGETTGKQQLKFLGLEDYWGNRRQWIDGCYYDSNRNMLIGKSNYNNTGDGYTDFGQASGANLSGYIDTVQGTSETGFIPKSTGGSDSTYYCDSSSLNGGRLPSFGGFSSNGLDAGGFHLFSSTASSAGSATIGGRLAFYSKPTEKLYIGAYLGATQSNKLRSISGQVSENDKTISAFRTLAKANN